MRITWLLGDCLAASGMVFPDDVPALFELGIGSVVSLSRRSPFPDGPPAGIKHLHLPVPDMSAPSNEVVRSAVRFLDHELDRGGKVLVHCGAGYGRTGTILACWLVSRGEDPEDAMRFVREARPGSIETPDQEELIRRWPVKGTGGSPT